MHYKSIQFEDFKVKRQKCYLLFSNQWLLAPNKIEDFTLKLRNCSRESVLRETYDMMTIGSTITSLKLSKDSDYGSRLLRFSNANYTSDFEDSEEERDFYDEDIPGFR